MRKRLTTTTKGKKEKKRKLEDEAPKSKDRISYNKIKNQIN